MRKNFVVWLLCLGCIVSVLLGCIVFIFNANKRPSIGSSNEMAQSSLLWMNYFNFVITKILDCNDQFVLEMEYNKLEDNLNFDTLPDKKCLEMVNEVLTTLKEMRFNAAERKLVQEEYEEYCNNLLLTWLKNRTITKGKQIVDDVIPSHWKSSVDPEIVKYGKVALKGWVVMNALYSPLKFVTIATYYTIVETEEYYKRKADFRRKVKVCALDRKKIEKLHQLRAKMLDYTFDVLKKHKLLDRYRISKGDYQNLLKYVQMETKDSYEVLNSEKCRRTFEKLPVYWFYLGKAAYGCGDLETALYAYDKYEQENLCIFRNDETELNVCLGKALTLLDVGKHEKDVFDQLEKIRKKSEIKNWRQRYVAASLFFAIGKYDEAEDLLTQNIIYLRELEKKKLTKYRDLLGTPNLTVDVFPDTSNLAIQRMLLALCLEKSGKQNEFIKELDTAEKELYISAAEMCCHWGALKNEQIFERLKVYMQGVGGSLKQGRVFSEAELQIPFIWFYAGKPDFNIELIGDDGSLAFVKNHKIRLNKEKTKIMLTFKLGRKLSFAQVKHAKVVVTHPFCSVQLLFSVAPLSEAKSWYRNVPPRAFKLESCEFIGQRYKF